jgi:hypothetical protein
LVASQGVAGKYASAVTAPAANELPLPKGAPVGEKPTNAEPVRLHLLSHARDGSTPVKVEIVLGARGSQSEPSSPDRPQQVAVLETGASGSPRAPSPPKAQPAPAPTPAPASAAAGEDPNAMTQQLRRMLALA